MTTTPTATPAPDHSPPPLGQLLKRKQAAEFLGVDEKFMTRYRDEDKTIPHGHVGRYIRFPQGRLERWVEIGAKAYGDLYGRTCAVCEQREGARTARRPRDEPR